MYPCAAVPHAVTVLYIFAVINLTALLNISLVEASVHVLDEKNRTVWKVPDLEADFSPGIPDDGIQGHLSYTNPQNACSAVQKVYPKVGPMIALIKRNECNFYNKVFNAQEAGYVAAIVHDLDSDKLTAMHGEGAGVVIPSVFIGFHSAQIILRYLNSSANYTVIIYPDYTGFDVLAYLIPFAVVIVLSFITMLVVVIVKWYRDYRVRKRSRLSKTNLKKLPLKKFKKGDPFDVCAICLDEYNEGDKLRILPCSHGYHQKCVDPWLTENRKLCPICKRKVVKGDDSDSSSDEGDGNRQTNSTPPTERTPLVANASIQTSGNGAVSSPSSGGQQTLLDIAQQINRGVNVCRDSSSGLRRNAAGRSPPEGHTSSLSQYESSVEVHDSRSCGLMDDDELTASNSRDDRVATVAQSDERGVDNDDGTLVGAVGGGEEQQQPSGDNAGLDTEQLLGDEREDVRVKRKEKGGKKKKKKRRGDDPLDVV